MNEASYIIQEGESVPLEELPGRMEAMEQENARLRRELEELKDAVRWILPPSHGIHGGPLVRVQAYYEDGSENEVITPHTQKMTISHENIEKARRLVYPEG
jgi:hypothetical protein